MSEVLKSLDTFLSNYSKALEEREELLGLLASKPDAVQEEWKKELEAFGKGEISGERLRETLERLAMYGDSSNLD